MPKSVNHFRELLENKRVQRVFFVLGGWFLYEVSGLHFVPYIRGFMSPSIVVPTGAYNAVWDLGGAFHAA